MPDPPQPGPKHKTRSRPTKRSFIMTFVQVELHDLVARATPK
jgi:hypothetical protein